MKSEIIEVILSLKKKYPYLAKGKATGVIGYVIDSNTFIPLEEPKGYDYKLFKPKFNINEDNYEAIESVTIKFS